MGSVGEITPRLLSREKLDDVLSGALVRIWGKYRKALKQMTPSCVKEPVHDFRVSSRRLISFLDAVRSVVPRKPGKKLRRLLRKRLRILNPLRDLHIQKEYAGDLAHAHSELKPLFSALVKRGKKAGKKIQDKVHLPKFRKIKKMMRQFEEQLHRSPKHLKAVLAEADEAFETAAGKWRGLKPENSASIHELRVAFKKFRYMLELFKPLLPGITEKQFQAVKAFQMNMGEIQDIEVVLECLKEPKLVKKVSEKALQRARRDLLKKRRLRVQAFMSRAEEIFAMQNPREASTTIVAFPRKEAG